MTVLREDILDRVTTEGQQTRGPDRGAHQIPASGSAALPGSRADLSTRSWRCTVEFATPSLTSHTFANLRSTGDLRLIRSQAAKDALFDYYGFDDEQRQYLPLHFQTEHRHFELASGVLTPEQEVFIQDSWLFFRPDTIAEARQAAADVAGVIEAAKRLQQRPALVAWLPQVRSMQLEQIAVHEMRLERARSTYEILSSYARSIR